MRYAAIYPEDMIAHHRAFIARRRAERPSEEYRDFIAAEWDDFLAHFELRKVALGTNLPSLTPRSDGKTPLLNLEFRRSPPSVAEPQRQPVRNSSEKLNRLFRS
jgi:hypothetical protein